MIAHRKVRTSALIPIDLRWRALAACRDVDAEIFFNPDRDVERSEGADERRHAAQAKEICARCPVQRQCLNWAVVVGEPHGIWGGLTPGERARLTGQLENAG